MIVFETGRLIVRRYTADDTANFFLIHGDEEIMRYIRPPKLKEECNRNLEEILADYTDVPGLGRWAVEEKDSEKFVGSFVFIPITDQPEKIQIGYALLKDYRGKGYATELTKSGLYFGFSRLGLDVIYGVTEMQNIPSQRVLLKSGFKEAETYFENEKIIRHFSISKSEWKLNGSI